MNLLVFRGLPAALLTVCSVFFVPQSVAHDQLPQKILGLRVDPAYFYEDFQGQSPEVAARNVVHDAQVAGFNTLFIFAYSPVYGAFYPTSYPHAPIEKGHGKADVFGLILKASKQAKLSVVAAFPLNNFKAAWEANPSWRSKTKEGSDYKPSSDYFLLSAWNPDFRAWHRDLMKDFLNRYPAVDGVEVAEGFVDWNWNSESDYHPLSKKPLQSRYPASNEGGKEWKQLRAEALTDLHGEFTAAARASRKPAFVVQTWAVDRDGELLSEETIRDGSGFDFKGLMHLPRGKRPDYIVGEFLWQQWKAQHGGDAFSPEWTKSAAKTFIGKVSPAARPIVHIEASSFKNRSGLGETAPTAEEFDRTLRLAVSSLAGVDVYSYHLLKRAGWLDRVAKILKTK